jgi:pimeloyl-ACP methyl ester carboxylesterase
MFCCLWKKLAWELGAFRSTSSMSYDLVGTHALPSGNENDFYSFMIGPSQPPKGAYRVVLVHGWLGCHKAWLNTANWLHQSFGHSVLLLDLYGWGRSAHFTREEFTAPLYARQLRACIEKVRIVLHYNSFPSFG